MHWNPKDDSFKFHFTTFQIFSILRYIAQMYDPLDFLSSVIFYLKWFMQQLWLLKVYWDDPLPEGTCDAWTSFTSEMECLSAISIPRYFDPYHEPSYIVGFSDASERDNSAAVYYVPAANFEVIPRCGKNILRSATSEEVRNKQVLQKQKKCVWKIKNGIIKMYGTCQDKRVCLKKEIKEETTEYVCSKKYVRSTKGTFHFGKYQDFMEPEQKKANGL